jgi:hypothetical protein
MNEDLRQERFAGSAGSAGRRKGLSRKRPGPFYVASCVTQFA